MILYLRIISAPFLMACVMNAVHALPLEEIEEYVSYNFDYAGTIRQVLDHEEMKRDGIDRASAPKSL